MPGPKKKKKIQTKRPQDSIFMGNFQFYQDRVRKICIAVLSSPAKFSFCFVFTLGLLLFHLFMFNKLYYIKPRFRVSQYKYLSDSC